MRSNKSVFIFIALVFVLSVPFWILSAVNPIQLLPGLPLSALQAFVPAVSAIILVYRSNHFSAIRQLLQKSFDFRKFKSGTWYVPVLLINPLIAVLAYWYLRAVDPSFPNPAPLTFAVVPMTVAFFITALGEELGWSGYATEPLLERWGLLPTGLFQGAVWAVWHFIPLLQADRSTEWIAWWSLGTLGLRLIMVWVFAFSGRSVFGMAVFHAMTNVCWQLFPVNGSHYDPRVFGSITFAIALAIFAARYAFSKGTSQAPSSSL